MLWCSELEKYEQFDVNSLVGFVRVFRTKHQIRKCSEDQKKEEYYIIYDRVPSRRIIVRKHTLWKYNMNLALRSF